MFPGAFNDQARNERSFTFREAFFSDGAFFIFYFSFFLLLPVASLKSRHDDEKREGDCFVHVFSGISKTLHTHTHTNTRRRRRHMQRCLKLVKTAEDAETHTSAETTKRSAFSRPFRSFRMARREKGESERQVSNLWSSWIKKRCPAVGVFPLFNNSHRQHHTSGSYRHNRLFCRCNRTGTRPVILVGAGLRSLKWWWSLLFPCSF